ncbi:MAG: 4-hydroxy-3-methylbut-2-enyl diphosphate reductase, partial [bacterium]
MRILIAKPRGFCAGVDRAIDVVEAALEIFGPPVYMRHQIVHNRYIVEQLEKKGAVFVEKTADIPEGANVVFSAHGVSQKVREEAKQRNLKVIDATCPLVMKVHFEVGLYAQKGYSIILIGHKGHVEMEGTIGEAPEAVTLIETIDEAKNLEIQNPERCIILT